MRNFDTPEARGKERALAIADLKKAGWSAKAITRIIGGPTVASDKSRSTISDVDVQIELIAQKLCAYLRDQGWTITLDDLRGLRINRAIAAPRGAAMWLAREILGDGASFPAIGRYFGRDHSTVIHACSDGAGWLKIDDPRLERAVAHVCKSFKRQK